MQKPDLSASVLPDGTILPEHIPATPLTRAERMVAYLLGEGLSGAEISRALRIDREAAQEAVGSVLRKLKLRSASQVADLLEERRTESPPVGMAVKN